jgi:hypothetical protein
VGGVHVVVGVVGVTTAVLLVGDDDVGCNDEEVGNLVVAGVVVVVETAAHRQSPNRESHFNGSSIGQLQRQSAAEAHVPLHEPSYIELQLLP